MNKNDRAPFTTSLPRDMRDDLFMLRKQHGVSANRVLESLYRAWRDGGITVSTLPNGADFGPISRPGRG